MFNVGADTPYTVNYLSELEVFGYKPEFSLEEGISRMAKWAKSVGARRSRPFEGIEIRKNMSKSWEQALG